MSATGDDIRLTGGGNALAAERARHKTTTQLARRTALLGVACALLLVACVCAPTYVFNGWQLAKDPAQLVSNVVGQFGELMGVLTGDAYGPYLLHLCTYAIAAVGGATLGVCGSVYQGALRNPLAAPKTLGVMGGGALGAFIYLIWVQPRLPVMINNGDSTVGAVMAWQASLGPLEWVMLTYGKALCSIVGCLAVVALVIGVSALVGRGRLSNITMIVTGQVVAGGVSALILYYRYVYISSGNDELAQEMAEIENYVLTSTYTPVDVAVVCVPLLACLAVVWAMRRKLTALTLGDEEAQAMGVSVNRLRYGMVAVCTVMTAISISFAGHVAFLGFISAHLARKYVGPDMRYLLPCSLFTGAMAMTLVHYLTSTGFALAVEGSEGMLVSIIGACVFLAFALRDRGGSGDWR